ncbi:MAG: hypothetical protein ACI80V_002708 [Rhodothermales bacterium]
MKSFYPALCLFLLLVGCAPSEPDVAPVESTLPELTSRADSLAMRALEASGGEMALRSIPYLAFNFGSAPRGRRHLWDRMSGDYRLEYSRGDTAVVVLFNTQTREGAAYRDGALAADSEALVTRAYGAFINDSYWLMMPVKMLDPGVTRALVPDSSSAEFEVVKLSFDNVGLTPGDTYYVYVDRETGMVRRWHYVLQSGSQNRCDWAEYQELAGPRGAVKLSSRKDCTRSQLMTDGLATPATVPEGAFTDPSPMTAEA